MPGIASDFEKRFRAGAEQQIVDDLLILLGQGHQLMREREDSMHVARGLRRLLPEALALRAEDPAIRKALAPIVEGALTTSIRTNPHALADALFPVRGPAGNRGPDHCAGARARGGRSRSRQTAAHQRARVRGQLWQQRLESKAESGAR